MQALGASAFSYCSNLLNIKLPASLVSIGSDCFYNCSKILSITLKSTTPPVVGSNGLYNVSRTSCKLIIPTGTTSVYASASPWSEFTLKSENSLNAVSQINAENIQLSSFAGKIIVKGDIEGRRIEIFSIDGKKADEFMSDSNEFSTQVEQGVYIIRIENYSKKITVK